MAKEKKPLFIGIVELYYGEVFTEKPTPATIAAWLKNATQITNSHQDTFTYEQEDGNEEEYIDELSGEIYYVDATTQGKRTMSFAIGQYDYADKAALQGGAVEMDDDGTTPIGWSAPTKAQTIHKGLVAKVKTGNYVVFTNGSVKGKVNRQQKNLALGVTATAMASEIDGIKSEYWYTGTKIDAARKSNE